jgi:hypothetical protein
MNILLSLLLTFAWANEDWVPIEFETEIKTCLSQEILWEQLSVAMKDSGDSWLWPDNRSEVVGEGLANKSLIEVTYKTTFSDPTYTYELTEVKRLKQFTYLAVEGKHPFIGGATLKLEKTLQGTVFTWKGRYLTHPDDWIERRFFRSFSRRFFRDLEKNIERNENLCQ